MPFSDRLLRGAIRFIIRSGGLRGLRPLATFFATLRVVLRSLNYINTLAKPRPGLNSDRCSAAWLQSLGQHLVHERDGNRSFAHRGRYSFHVTSANVSDSEDAGQARFK